MSALCSFLPSRSSRFLHSGNHVPLWHNDAMSMRERIKAVIASKPDLSIRNVSLAAEMSDSMLNKFLSGRTESMTIRTAEKLAEALGVDAQWLIFGEGDPDRATDIAKKIEMLTEQQQQLIQRLIDELPRNGTTG